MVVPLSLFSIAIALNNGATSDEICINIGERNPVKRSQKAHNRVESAGSYVLY